MTDLYLNPAELSTLKNFAALDAPADHWIRIPNPGQEFRQAVDILVLSGLVERRADFRADPFGPQGWLDQWRLTPAGVDAVNYRPQTSLFTS